MAKWKVTKPDQSTTIVDAGTYEIHESYNVLTFYTNAIKVASFRYWTQVTKV